MAEKRTGLPIERRQYYRVVYPAAYRPLLVVRGDSYPVINLSQRGVCIHKAGVTRLPVDLIHGQLHVHRSEPLDVLGRFEREEGDQAVLVLTRLLPYQVILSEQVYLRQRRLGVWA